MPNELIIDAHFKCRDCRSVSEVVEKLPRFRWKVQEPSSGGKIAYAVISGNKETGEVWVLAILENAAAPRHEHVAGGPYGEWILTIAGCLQDVDDSGKEIHLYPGDMLFHGGGTIHTPKPSSAGNNAFWFGLYHQPRGSRPA